MHAKAGSVLIVGAGPTGLALALFLARNGIKPRIIDRKSGPEPASRAIVVQARTLEFYRQLGIADEAIALGIIIETLHLREGSRETAQFKFTDLGGGLSPYPFPLSLPQDDHERFLIRHLRDSGVEVEWGTEFKNLTQGTNVSVEIEKDSQREICEFSWVCGCDGTYSLVRQEIGVSFPGGTYDQLFFVADVRATGAAAESRAFNMCLTGQNFVAVFPVRSTGNHRLIGIVPQSLAGRENLKFSEFQKTIEDLVGIRVLETKWFSTYHVHHRVAENFRKQNVFLLGDAGHVHSPAGGQGMNTGIGDAVNLAWKLAAVIDDRINESVLDTYESERIAFARLLVETTDKVFKAIVGTKLGSQVIRTVIVPHLIPTLLGFTTLRKAAYKFLSQTRISYPDSPLSKGRAGTVDGGDRLPWIRYEETDNFKPLESLDWQVHVYGSATSDLKSAAAGVFIPVFEFPWNDAADASGVKQNAVYLIRPDGHVAYAGEEQNPAEMLEFIQSWKIKPRA